MKLIENLKRRMYRNHFDEIEQYYKNGDVSETTYRYFRFIYRKYLK